MASSPEQPPEHSRDGEGREAPPPSFTCPIHPNAAQSAVIGSIPFLPRSALACWWSISHLIRVYSPCYLWTFTMAKVYPDAWFGNMHRSLTRNVSDAAKRQYKSSTGGTIPKSWGGVRVFEVHPRGHGLHAHWVMNGYMDWHIMQQCAIKAGFGKVVHVDPKPVSLATAYYLACYLTKNDKIHGCRQWANIGNYEGVGKRDITQDSARIQLIKAWQWYYRQQGDHRYLAYRKAVQNAEDGLPIPGANPF